MTDTERAISFFENALENCVMVARKPFETALDALRRTAEDDKAREEGTLVVLPCRVGDTVYRVCKEFASEEVVTRIYTVGTNEWRFRTEDFTKSNWSMLLSDFGKTVFLTRQAAEVALGGGESG